MMVATERLILEDSKQPGNDHSLIVVVRSARNNTLGGRSGIHCRDIRIIGGLLLGFALKTSELHTSKYGTTNHLPPIWI